MKPKKKSSEGLIVGIITLILALALALYTAIGYEQAQLLLEQGTIEERDLIITVLSKTVEQLTYYPSDIYFTSYTMKFVVYFGFAWLIIVLMIVNSKKNYIHGKEFGEARWGTINDIKDLFAINIAKVEIKKAQRLKNCLGRHAVKKEMYKQCEADGQFELKKRLEEAKRREDDRKRSKTANKALYKEEVKNIREEVKKDVAEAKIHAWKPSLYERECAEEIEKLKKSNFYTESELSCKIAEIMEKYDRKTKDFFDVNLQARKIKDKYAHADILFTKQYKMSFYNYILNQNVLILGGSGAGKTRGYVMPNVLQATPTQGHSYIITDPKGEILEKGGYYLEKICGYKIRVLNLDEKKNSDGYNPFVYIHPERDGYEERVLSLIETIMLNTDGEKKGGGSDPFWDKAERLFLQSIFFFTVDAFTPEYRNMGTVMNLIGKLQIEEEQDNYDSDLDYFAEMVRNKFGDDYIGYQQYKEFRSKASGKTAKSIVISAVARLAPFKTKEVKRLFSYDNMDLDRVGEERYAIFLVTPPTDKSFNFIGGMLYTQLFQELQYCATQVHKHDGQKLPVPCRFILDEFYNTCEIPNFVNILSYARSFGISITIILQSLEQIKAMYEKEYGVVIDNCNTLLYLGSINHKDTLEYMSQLLGKGTFDKRTTGRTRGRQGSSSENFDVVGRELMFPDDIRKMPKDECLLVLGGRPPFYDKKYEYKEHENYRLTSDANPKYSYEYTPLPPPEISHREKKVVIPTKDSIAEGESIVYNPNEDVSDTVQELTKDLKNHKVEFINAIGGGSDEEYLAVAEELEEQRFDTLAQLIEVNQAFTEARSEVEEIKVLSVVGSIRELGRSFRNHDFVPVGYIGEEKSIEELGEEEQDAIVNEVEQLMYEEEEEETSYDDVVTDDFTDGLEELLNLVPQDDVLFGNDTEEKLS